MTYLKDTLAKHSIYADFDDYTSFSMWFIQCGRSKFNIINLASNQCIGQIHQASKLSIQFSNPDDAHLRETVIAEFCRFLKRPEAQIGRMTRKVEESLMISNSMVYTIKLLGCVLCSGMASYVYDIDNSTEIIDRFNTCYEWLSKTDFYTAPASSKYHDSFTGGLASHSLNVTDRVADLLQVDAFNHVKIHEAILVALVHDWCKIGYYESYNRNVKGSDGVWRSEASFKTADKSLTCFGHGVSSMALAMRFFPLTDDQLLAIRWHMGEYNVANNEMNELHQANATVPMCYLIQFADRLACTEY